MKSFVQLLPVRMFLKTSKDRYSKDPTGRYEAVKGSAADTDNPNVAAFQNLVHNIGTHYCACCVHDLRSRACAYRHRHVGHVVFAGRRRRTPYPPAARNGTTRCDRRSRRRASIDGIKVPVSLPDFRVVHLFCLVNCAHIERRNVRHVSVFTKHGNVETGPVPILLRNGQDGLLLREQKLTSLRV